MGVSMYAFVCVCVWMLFCSRYLGTGLQCKYISHHELGLKSLENTVGSQYWEHGVLATGLPGKSPDNSYYNHKVSLSFVLG